MQEDLSGQILDQILTYLSLGRLAWHSPVGGISGQSRECPWGHGSEVEDLGLRERILGWELIDEGPKKGN